MNGIYLDHAATAPLRPEVAEAMEPHFPHTFGNPSSVHRWGREARNTLEAARDEAAGALGVSPHEVVFLGGATEADNLAILGRALTPTRGRPGGSVAISTLEHSAVRDAAELFERAGGRVIRIGVSADGTLAEDELDAALSTGVDVLSVIWVNNEVGIRLPVEAVAERAREAGVVMHSDAVQAVGRVPIRLDRTPLDLLSVSGHKLGGPRGTGALVVRSGVELAPRAVGGGQEGGLRSGTENVVAAVGLARAISLAVAEQETEAARLQALVAALAGRLREGIERLVVHGEEAPRAPHILSVGIPEVAGDLLLSALDLEGVAVSAGSACSSGVPGPGHALRALYGEAARGRAPVRFSLGRSTTGAEVHEAAERTVSVVARVRKAGRGAL